MKVLTEILKWSQDRPAWQRDALRRLVLKGQLADNDLHDLTEICKSAHGLSDFSEIVPLATDHIPNTGAGPGPVTLVSIFHHHGVNALAENQTLNFAPKLTAVYGDNAAGKTGYIRILKSACRARGTEDILGNVVSGSSPISPVVEIRYKVGEEESDRTWTGQNGDDDISRVSVFDTQSAAVYLTEKTDVAFRPFGLDLFDKLVKVCKSVRTRLESEQRSLGSSTLTALQAQVPENTAVSKLLTEITSLTKPETVQSLADLSPIEKERLSLIEKSLLDLQANDPNKLRKILTLRAERVQALSRHLNSLETTLSEESVAAALEAKKEWLRKVEEAKRLRAATFDVGMLDGTGTESWALLWESARRFSEESAYPEREFPVLDSDAKCVFCQQDLVPSTRDRLKQFAAFAVSTTEQELRDARDLFQKLRKSLVEFNCTNEAIEETVKEVRIDHEGLAEAVTALIAANECRRASIESILDSDMKPPFDYPALVSIASDVARLSQQLDERVKTLSTSSTDEERERMNADLLELRARVLLAKNEQLVLNEIERKKEVAAYELCLNDTKTHTITQKSTVVTRTTVTQMLKKNFQDELVNLGFRHVEVELKEVGGSEGVLYHKLVLTRAPGVDLPRVVSEGEQRCLAIAAFFAELSTADNPSGIVFDDPVSSLDYRWRESVASRLVEEAKTRQVIVFTHDVVFLLLLKQFSEEQCVKQLDQHVRQLSKGAGVCAEELPWVALKVKARLGHLKKLQQDALKLHNEGHQAAYEKEASLIYGYLREAWERGLEEVLLGGVVERYRPGVQTQQVLKIADISEEDCKELESAMTKCSKWLPGHDQAAAARADIPDPRTLKTDIEALDNWVSRIRKRRN